MAKNNSKSIHGVRLNIELGCQLSVQVEGIKERLTSYFVGMVPESCIIIKTPPTMGIRDLLIQGDPVIIRYVYLGEVFGFESTVLGVIKSPRKLTFLTYPNEIEKINLRKMPRVSCYIPASLIHEKFEIKGVISNISSDGSKFSTKPLELEDKAIENLQIDEGVKLHFPLLGMEGIQEFTGIIKNKTNDSNGVGLGIKFENIDPKISAMLDSYINQVTEYEGA